MYVIADDLTGSNDTAIQYRNAGYSAIVPVLAEASSFSGFDLVAINTDSRMMSAEDSYRSVFAMVEPFKGVSSRLVYKKIDSQLRGNPGTELQAVMDCLGFRTAFIAPSFPKNGRVIAGGKLELPGGAVDALELFSSQMSGTVRYVADSASIDRDSTGVFLFDASTDDDLRRVAALAGEMHDEPLLCGSAGLASCMMAPSAQPRAFPAADIKEGAVLALSGSLHMISRNQFEKASSDMKAEIFRLDCRKDDLDRAAADFAEKIKFEIRAGAGFVLGAVSSMFDGTVYDVAEADRSLEIAKAMGKAALEICTGVPVKGILVNGGDTCLNVFKAMGAGGIIPCHEVRSGIPYGVMTGGPFDGLPVITKSGGFGNPDAVKDCVSFLMEVR